MFLSDLHRTFAAWRRQPMLPLSVLALSAAIAFAGAGDSLPLAPAMILLLVFYVGFLATQRVWYVRAWDGRGLTPGETVRLSLGFFWPYVALGLVAGILGLLVYYPVSLLAGELPARIVAMIAVDVPFTFVTSAIAVDRLAVAEAIPTGWRVLRTGFRRCAPHALLPPLVLYAFADRQIWWLFVVAELVALVARGVTTSYYVRHTVRPRAVRAHGEARDPALSS